jgi:hypothetical protein
MLCLGVTNSKYSPCRCILLYFSKRFAQLEPHNALPLLHNASSAFPESFLRLNALRSLHPQIQSSCNLQWADNIARREGSIEPRTIQQWRLGFVMRGVRERSRSPRIAPSTAVLGQFAPLIQVSIPAFAQYSGGHVPYFPCDSLRPLCSTSDSVQQSTGCRRDFPLHSGGLVQLLCGRFFESSGGRLIRRYHPRCHNEQMRNVLCPTCTSFLFS